MPVNRYYSSIAVDTTLAVGCSSTDTTITVYSTTGFPTSFPYTLAIDYDTSAEELVNVVGASGTTLTVGTTVGVADITGRGVDQGSTYRQAHSAGAVVKHVISGRDVREPQEHMIATTSVHGIADTSLLTTASNTQTFTNKTLTSPTINGGTISGTVTNSGTISGGTLSGNTVSGATLSGTTTATSGTIALGTNASAITANSTTVSATELGYLDGVTSAIQTQIDGKLATPGSWTSYTPTFGGTGWSGSATGKYLQVGKTVFFYISASSSANAGSGQLTLSIPSTPGNSIISTTCSGYYNVQFGASNPIQGYISSGTQYVQVNALVTGSASGVPIAWSPFTSSLSISPAGTYSRVWQFSGFYEVA